MASTKPVLTYFNLKGRAEAIRLACCIGGIDFVDKRITKEEFMKLKPSLPFGQVPVLEDEGQIIAESLAILFHVGSKSDLSPKDPMLLTQVSEILFAINDVTNALGDTLFQPDDVKLKMRTKLANETLPAFFENFEKRIGKRGKNGFCVGDKMTIADLYSYCTIAWIQTGILDNIPKTLVDKYPNIMKMMKSMNEHPKIKEWNSVDRSKAVTNGAANGTH